MSTNRSIVGLCLVRNEERFLDLVLANIFEFCDRILIADHQSTDTTAAIGKQWAEQHASVTYKRVNHPVISHEMIMPYVDTPTWIFAVDGDEIYDPRGLGQLRHELKNGTHDSLYRITGNVLNCISLDTGKGSASGYLSPPSRTITKLYNFQAIRSWSGVKGERLHGGEIVFNKGYDQSACLRLQDKVVWEDAIFRCLHLCFIPRSSKDKTSQDTYSRWNIAEQQNRGILIYMFSKLLMFLGRTVNSGWKEQKYMRGDLATKDVSVFLEHYQKTRG